MRAPHAGHRFTAVLAGVLLTGAALAVPATAAGPQPTGSEAAAPQAAKEPQGKVVSKLPLTIREKPTTKSRALGSIAVGKVINLRCKDIKGENVDGNRIWYRLGTPYKAGWVAARYVKNSSHVSECPK